MNSLCRIAAGCLMFCVFSGARPAATAPEWLSTRGNNFVTASGKPVILRGFVVITHYLNGRPLIYSPADYQRMKSLGANYQSIRIGASRIGAWKNTQLQPAYLTQLDRMVALGRDAGMHSNFKLTVYDVKALVGFGKKKAWKSIWENKNGEQERIIEAWKILWRRYQNEPAIIAYDLLNEPEKGSLNVSDEEFIKSYLVPFYQKAIDAFHEIDRRHYAMFQSPYGAPHFNVSVNRSQIIYAPHFYPNFINYFKKKDFSTTTYVPTMKRFLSEAQKKQRNALHRRIRDAMESQT